MKEAILLGCIGNHADVIDILEKDYPEIRVIGILDDKESFQKQLVDGIPVLGKLDRAVEYKDTYFINTIAGYNSHRERAAIVQKTGIPEEKFLTIISSRASVASSAKISTGAIILPGVSIGGNALIGKFVFLFHGVTISHDTVIGDHSIIAANTGIAGGCCIGNEVYIGIGSALRDRTIIGNRALIGMGSVVVSDIPEGAQAYGNPAKVKGDRR